MEKEMFRGLYFWLEEISRMLYTMTDLYKIFILPLEIFTKPL
jgi:hypothetical protein